MADAWFKGVRNFDVKTAYAGLRKNSLEGTHLAWRNGAKGALDDFYNEHGYLPGLLPDALETDLQVHPRESASPWRSRWKIAATIGILPNWRGYAATTRIIRCG